MTEPFLKVPLSLYRSGIISVIGHNLVTVYNALRCYIFRTEKQGTQSIQKLNQQGHLVAEVSQGKLAKLLGMKRQTVNKLLQQLSVLGWIQYDSLELHRVCTYVLGSFSIDKEGNREENFYSDSYVEELSKHVENAIKNRRAQIPLYNQKENQSQDSLQEEELQFRIDFISHYIANKARETIHTSKNTKKVDSFSLTKESQRLLNNIDFLEKINNIGAIAPSFSCASKGTGVVPQKEQGLLPSGNTEYINTKNKEYINRKDQSINIINIKDKKNNLELFKEKNNVDLGFYFVELNEKNIEKTEKQFEIPEKLIKDQEQVEKNNLNVLNKWGAGVKEKVSLEVSQTNLQTTLLENPITEAYLPLFSIDSRNESSGQEIGFTTMNSKLDKIDQDFNKKKIEKSQKEPKIYDGVNLYNYTQEQLDEADALASKFVVSDAELYALSRPDEISISDPSIRKHKNNFSDDIDEHDQFDLDLMKLLECDDVEAPDESSMEKEVTREYTRDISLYIPKAQIKKRTEEEIKKLWLSQYKSKYGVDYQWTAKDLATITRLGQRYRSIGGLHHVYNFVFFIFRFWDLLCSKYDLHGLPILKNLMNEDSEILFEHMFKIQKYRENAVECETKFQELGSLQIMEKEKYETALIEMNKLGYEWERKVPLHIN